MKLGLVTSPRYLDHAIDPHPESQQRLVAIEEAMKREKVRQWTHAIKPFEADDEILGLVHTHEHIQTVREACSQGRRVALDADTLVCPDSNRVARLAVGGGCAAADAVLRGEVKKAMALVRPPGHHATPMQAMGFCLFSNVAVLARWLQQVKGLRRILIMDFDVHHGNGTQDATYEDDTVFFVSTHQYPLYPGTGAASDTGAGKGEGYTRNLPFPPNTPAQQVIDAVEEVLEEIAPQFQPDFLLVSAGFDGHQDDPLAEWIFRSSSYRSLTRILCKIADRYAQGRLVSMLEGGYNLNALPKCVIAHMECLWKP